MTLDRDYLLDSMIEQMKIELDDVEPFEEAIRIAVDAEIEAWEEEGDEFDYQLFEENLLSSVRSAVGLD